MNGNTTKVIKIPPIMKQMVAIKDGHCKFDNPMMACPEVHPPAYRVPNPTKNPPKTIKKKPFRLSKSPKLNNSVGNKPLKLVIPKALKSVLVSSEMATSAPLLKKLIAINAPAIIPNAKKNIHCSFFQSYLKNGISDGKSAAQVCLRLLEIPKVLFPKMSKSGTVSPIIGPAMYHGHGFNNKSIISIYLVVWVKNIYFKIKFRIPTCLTENKKCGIIQIFSPLFTTFYNKWASLRCD